MRRLIPCLTTVSVLLLLMAAGCKDVPISADKLDEGDPSITITSGDSSVPESSVADSAVYNFNELAWACIDDNDFGQTYQDLSFNESPRWAVCDARSNTDGHDGKALLPADSRLHHNRNDGTTQLDSDTVMFATPADSVSLITANYDRPKEDYVTKRNFASWLVALDAEGNEIDRALNSQGNYKGVELVVHAAPDTSIHAIIIETYPEMTYLDNLRTFVTTGPPPDTTAPQFEYTILHDSLTNANRKMVLAVSDIYSYDDRGGPVALTVSVESSDDVIGPGNPTAPDWEFTDNGDGTVDVSLRAEYTDKEVGRVYTISLRAEDVAGNVAEESFEIVVPKVSGK